MVVMGLLTTGCSTEAPKACSPPRSSWGKPRSFGLVALNKIALDRTGKTYWNGEQVSRKTLDEYLALSPSMNPEPWVFLEAEMGASCAALEAVRDQVEKHIDCSTGYRCNEGIKTIWNHTPSLPGSPVS